MTETPEDIYKILTSPAQEIGFITLDDVIKLINHYRNQVAVLASHIRDEAEFNGACVSDEIENLLQDKWSE